MSFNPAHRNWVWIASEHGKLPALLPSCDLDAVRIALDKNPSLIHLRDAVGDTLLVVAAGVPKPDVVRLLLERGAPVHSCAPGDSHPLNIAAQETRDVESAKQLVDVLLEFGADLNSCPRGMNGWSPLHYAACWGHPDMVDHLIDRGADINIRAQDHGECTPLMDAVWPRRADSIARLLARGADWSLLDAATDETAEENARGEGFTQIVELLEQARTNAG